jgi:EmrB/QacA subfamily drug resistance transporter
VSRQQLLTLIATILGSTVVFLDATVVNVALPAINADLNTGLSGQQWVVEAYSLTLVALLLVGGSLGDQFGRRRMYVIGLIGFGAMSALCAVAPTTGLLIGARALQGVAGALLVPGSLAIVAATFEGPARGKAVGTWTAWTGIATVLGPAGGGALIEAISWRAIFWINLPLIVATVALTLHSVRESRDPDAYMGIDWAGIALSAVGLGGPVYALIEQPAHGWGDPQVWVPMVVGISCFALFILREARARHPMLDLTLFRIRNFWVTNLTTFSTYAGLIGGLFFVGLFLQQVAGYSPLQAGLATTPISIVMFFLSPRFGKMASGVGPRTPMFIGPIVGGIGLLLLLRVGSELPPRRTARSDRFRPRSLGDGGAADRHRARLGRGTTCRGGLGRQQRGFARSRSAGDRRPRRRDLGQLRLDDRFQPRPATALVRRRRSGRRSKGTAARGARNRPARLF